MSIRQPFSRSTLVVILADVLSLIAAGGFALLVRFEFSFERIPPEYKHAFLRILPWQILLTVVIFWLMHMYHFVWRTVSAHDVVRMVLPVIVANLSVFAVRSFLRAPMPRSVTVIELMGQLLREVK